MSATISYPESGVYMYQVLLYNNGRMNARHVNCALLCSYAGSGGYF